MASNYQRRDETLKGMGRKYVGDKRGRFTLMWYTGAQRRLSRGHGLN